MKNKQYYSIALYTPLQLKDIARSEGIKVTYNMPLFKVVELLNKL